MKTVTFNIVPASGYERLCHRQKFNITDCFYCICAIYCNAALREACPCYDPDRMHPKHGTAWTEAERNVFYEVREAARLEYGREYTE